MRIVIWMSVLWQLACGSEEDEDVKDSLYLPADPILQLNVSTFNASIYGNHRSFFVEFYSSWCGHCINFAPYWQKLANDVKEWREILQISAVNCALDENMPLCRQHNVHSYPTITYFKYMPNSRNDSYDFLDVRENVDHLRKSVLKFVLADYFKNKPPTWPEFSLLEKETGTSDLFSLHPTMRWLAIIFDAVGSNVGPEVMLDLHSVRAQGVIIRLAPSEHRLAESLKLSKFPALAIFKRGLDEPVYVSVVQLSRQDAVAKIRFYTNLLVTNAPEDSVPRSSAIAPVQPPNDVASKAINVAHTTDLLSAISYMLLHEIAQQSLISIDQLSVINDFFALLVQYLPEQLGKIKGLLTDLSSSLKNDVANPISGELWTEKLQKLQVIHNNALLPRVQWVSCKGSTSRYRGYPCGLWMLFHTLTVNAYKRSLNDVRFQPVDVLRAIRGYVTKLFGCKMCANNFAKEAIGLEDQAKDRADVVLWLWETHNKVNERLRGDKTEDPSHPKRPFPSSALCANCRTARGFWQKDAVLTFLLSFYGNLATNLTFGDSDRSRFVDHRFDHEKLRTIEQNFLFGGDNGQSSDNFRGNGAIRQVIGAWLNFSTYDISICFVLWFASALLLLGCFVLFRYGRLKVGLKRLLF